MILYVKNKKPIKNEVFFSFSTNLYLPIILILGFLSEGKKTNFD